MATKSHRVQFKLANSSDAKVMARLRKMLCSSNLGWIGKCSRCEVPEQEKMLNSSLIEQFGQITTVGVNQVIGSDLMSLYLLGCSLHCFCLFFQQDFLSFCWVGWMALPPLLVPPPVLEATTTSRLLLRMSLSSSSVPLQCPMSNLLKRHNFAWSAP